MTTDNILMGLPKTPIVTVHTTTNRGFTTREIAARTADKILSIAETAHPVIREQANTFKDQLRQQILVALDTAVKSDRTTTYNDLKKAGHDDLADFIIRR